MYLNWLEVNYYKTVVCFCFSAKIQIRPKGEGISVYAPSHGLHEVYFDKNSWMVKATITRDNLGIDIQLE